MTRKRVTANDVLLKTAARMEKLLVTLPNKPTIARFSGSMSHTCLPKPKETFLLTKHIEMSKKILTSHLFAFREGERQEGRARGQHTHEMIKI